jgi:hypothetical protein
VIAVCHRVTAIYPLPVKRQYSAALVIVMTPGPALFHDGQAPVMTTPLLVGS